MAKSKKAFGPTSPRLIKLIEAIGNSEYALSVNMTEFKKEIDQILKEINTQHLRRKVNELPTNHPLLKIISNSGIGDSYIFTLTKYLNYFSVYFKNGKKTVNATFVETFPDLEVFDESSIVYYET